jgi:hypothetical protein
LRHELELDRDGQHALRGHAVQQQRLVAPPPDGRERRLVEQGLAPKDPRVQDAAKLMYARTGMVTPCYCHHRKKEDIICRWGELSLRA